MGKRFIRIPLAYALQNGTERKTNGSIEYGYPVKGTYNDRKLEYEKHAELFFNIPADLYKYIIGVQRLNYRTEYELGIVIPNHCLEISRQIRYNKVIYYGKTSYETFEDVKDTIFLSSKCTAETRPGEIWDTIRFSYEADKLADEIPYPDDCIPLFFVQNENHRNDLQILEPDNFVLSFSVTASSFPNVTKTDWGEISTYYAYYTKLNNIEDIYLLIQIEDIEINVTPVYPVAVFVRKDRDTVVTWDVSNSAYRDTQYLYPTSSVVQITDDQGNTLTFSVPNGDKYKELTVSDISSLDIGKCTGKIIVTTNYGTVGEGNLFFELIGESSAPDITSVTQDSYPTVYWECGSQISWEMIIKSEGKIVYQTGMKAGNDKQFTIPELLPDGNYSIEMRALNEYGIYTIWSSYPLILNPPKPIAPTNVIVSSNTRFGITVDCDPLETAGKLLVVRRKDSKSKEEILGEYSEVFYDYTIPLNESYEYTIRHYSQGYADGKWVDGVVNASGVVIRDSENYNNIVHVWMSESNNNNYSYDDDRSDVLVYCVGRSYPVAEIGEWITSVRTFEGFVSDEDFQKLLKIKKESKNVVIQSNKEFMPCQMKLSDSGQYVENGRIVRFTMTRIDGDK